MQYVVCLFGQFGYAESCEGVGLYLIAGRDRLPHQYFVLYTDLSFS